MGFFSTLDIVVCRVDKAAFYAAGVATDDVDRWHRIRNAAFRAMKREGIVPEDIAFNVACEYAQATYFFSGWECTWEGAKAALGERLMELAEQGVLRL